MCCMGWLCSLLLKLCSWILSICGFSCCCGGIGLVFVCCCCVVMVVGSGWLSVWLRWVCVLSW